MPSSQSSDNLHSPRPARATAPAGRCLRAALAPAACLYAAATAARNALYDRRLLTPAVMPVPVICVGNISVGGTGKTPMTLWLCRHLLARARRPVILTRGYKADHATDGHNDEIRLLRSALPSVPVVMDPDRVRAARTALDRHAPDVLLLDDGFQHRRLARDLDLVLVDATRPFTHDALLPAGRLREHPRNLRRAHALVLTRSDQVPPDQLDELTRQARRFVPLVAHAQHRPVALLAPDDTRRDLAELRDQPVIAVSALGNPHAFAATLASLGARLVDRRDFPDHHHYTPRDLADLADRARRHNAWILTTEKDWVKLATLPSPPQTPIFRLTVEITLTTAREDLLNLIDRTLAATR